jgi:hypothetical protein
LRKILLILLLGLGLLGLALWDGWAGGEDPGAALLPGLRPVPVTTEVPLGEGPETERTPPPSVPVSSTERVVAAPTEEDADVEETASALGSLTGRVVDGTGRVVPGARVFLGKAQGRWNTTALEVAETNGNRSVRSTESDGEGSFRLEIAQGNHLQLVVISAGHVRSQEEREVRAGENVDWGDVVLEQAVILSGYVLDARAQGVSGAMLESMSVEALPLWGRQDGGIPVGRTGPDGAFTVDTLGAGPWRLRVRSERYPTGFARGATARPGERVTGIEIHLAESGTIRGRLTGIPEGTTEALEVRARLTNAAPDPTQNQDEEGFNLASSQREVEVGAGGVFLLEGLRAGSTWRLYARAAEEGVGSPRRSKTIVTAVGVGDVELSWLGESVLLGRVVDAVTGEPILEYKVTGEAGGASSFPTGGDGKVLDHHPDGRFRIGGFHPREDHVQATVSVSALGYVSWQRSGVRLGQEEELDLGDIRLEPAGTVIVRVLDRATAEPIRGATVHLQITGEEPLETFGRRFRVRLSEGEEVSGWRKESRETTDGDGVARLSAFPGRTCTLEVKARGHAHSIQRGMVLPLSGTTEVEVRLGRGGAVDVRIMDANGLPVEGREVRHRQAREPGEASQVFSSFGDNQTSGPDGRAKFSHLPAGRHEFLVSAAREGGAWMRWIEDETGQDQDWIGVTVVEGETAEVVITDEPSCAISGTVTELGQPLIGATVSLREDDPEGNGMSFFPGMGGNETKTDATGGWRLEHLAVGHWILEVRHSERAMVERREVSLRAGEQRLDLDLSVTILEGRVSDAEGVGLGDLRVAVRAEGDSHRTGIVVMATISGDEEEASVSVGSNLPSGARTGPDGVYRLRGVRAGVPLRVTASGGVWCKGTSDPLTLREGESRAGVNLTLFRGATLIIRVVTADGKPAGVGFVWGNRSEEDSEDGGDGRLSELIREGEATVTGLLPGTWNLQVQDFGEGNWKLEPRDVEVRRGETNEVLFILP